MDGKLESMQQSVSTLGFCSFAKDTVPAPSSCRVLVARRSRVSREFLRVTEVPEGVLLRFRGMMAGSKRQNLAAVRERLAWCGCSLGGEGRQRGQLRQPA